MAQRERPGVDTVTEGVRVALLGPVGVARGERLAQPTSAIVRTLLAALAVAGPPGVPVGTLRERIWGARGEELSESAVGVAVHRLRRWLRDAVGEAVTVANVRDRYVLQGADTDVTAFRELVKRAAGAEPAARTETLERALALWRGHALEDVTAEAVDPGLVAQLERERIAAATGLARAALAAGDPDRALPVLSPLTGRYPMDEPLLGAWIETLAACGRQAEALEAYERLRRRLDRQLGIAPGAELRELHLRVLRQETPRVKVRPQERRPRQVPAGPGDFTGREERVAAVLAVLGRGESPVVAGMGGVGKSALARHVAHRVREEFPDGQLYADLQGAEPAPADPAEALGRFLRALGVGGSAVPDGLAERAALYRTVLADRRMLVVLDNAADEAQVAPLLPGGAGCRVIVTSRARLTALPGARLIELDVLDARPARDLLTRIVGAPRVDAEPEAADELVRLCGGLPLALRIAGARLAAKPHWRLADLTARLRDRRRLDELAHHGLSVRTTLDVSYESLDATARRLYGLLGLLDAPDVPAWVPSALLDADGEDAVEALVDARLVEAVRPAEGEVRYLFHDLVREHARERGTAEIPEAERTAAVRRALGGWLALCDTVIHAVNRGGDALWPGGTSRYTPDPAATASAAAATAYWLERETEALTAAVGQAARLDDGLCWELAVRSSILFQPAHYIDAWRKVVDGALPAVRAAGNGPGTAAVLHRIAELGCARRDYRSAQGPVEEALALFEAAGDDHGVGLSLRQRAVIHRMAGRYDRALVDAGRSYALLHELGDAAGAAHALLVTGQVRAERGEPEAAMEVFGRARDMAHGAHDASVELQSVYGIGQALLALGQAEPARELFAYVGNASVAAGSRMGDMYAKHGLGCAYAALGRSAEATEALLAALDLARERRDRLTDLRVRYALAELYDDAGDRARAITELRHAVRLAEALGVPLWTARCRLALGELTGDDDLVRRAEQRLDDLGVRRSRQDVREM